MRIRFIFLILILLPGILPAITVPDSLCFFLVRTKSQVCPGGSCYSVLHVPQTAKASDVKFVTNPGLPELILGLDYTVTSFSSLPKPAVIQSAGKFSYSFYPSSKFIQALKSDDPIFRVPVSRLEGIVSDTSCYLLELDGGEEGKGSFRIYELQRQNNGAILMPFTAIEKTLFEFPFDVAKHKFKPFYPVEITVPDTVTDKLKVEMTPMPNPHISLLMRVTPNGMTRSLQLGYTDWAPVKDVSLLQQGKYYIIGIDREKRIVGAKRFFIKK